MSKMCEPRQNYIVFGEHTKPVWTVEYDALEAIGCIIEFHFPDAIDASEFYNENKASDSDPITPRG